MKLAAENLYFLVRGACKFGFARLILLALKIKVMDMKEKNKKQGYSCYEKKFYRFENPAKKIKRWGRNIKFAYQRIKYGYCDSDVWSIDYWFLNVMPGMIQQLGETTHGYPIIPESISHAVYGPSTSEDVDNSGMKQWKGILSKMVFLLNEANEDTCTKENKFEKEYGRVWEEFESKYGVFGEKISNKTEETDGKDARRIYFPGDVPEFKEISELYFNELKALCNYRDECKNKALDLFSKWFWNLWD